MKMKYFKHIYSLPLMACLLLVSCNKDVLDRPPLTDYVDSQFWRGEEDIRMYANAY